MRHRWWCTDQRHRNLLLFHVHLHRGESKVSAVSAVYIIFCDEPIHLGKIIDKAAIQPGITATLKVLFFERKIWEKREAITLRGASYCQLICSSRWSTWMVLRYCQVNCRILALDRPVRMILSYIMLTTNGCSSSCSFKQSSSTCLTTIGEK